MNCPACLQETTAVRFAAIGFVCPHCQQVFTLVEEEWRLLEPASDEPVERSPIQLGAQGRIQGIDFTVVGVAVRYYWMSADNHEPYFEPYRVYRYEHVLESPQGEPFVLSFASQQWWLARVIDPAGVVQKDYQHLEFAERSYHIRSFVPSSVSDAAGFFPFPMSRTNGYVDIYDFVSSDGRTITRRREPKIATGEAYPHQWSAWPGLDGHWTQVVEGRACEEHEVAQAFSLDFDTWKSVSWRPIVSNSVQYVPRKPLQAWQKWSAGVLFVIGIAPLPWLYQPAAERVAEASMDCPALFARLPKQTQSIMFETKRDNGVVRFETEMKQGALSLFVAMDGARTSISLDQKPEFVRGRQPQKRLDWTPALLLAGPHRLDVRCEAVAILQPQQRLKIEVFDGRVARPPWILPFSALMVSVAGVFLLWRERA